MLTDERRPDPADPPRQDWRARLRSSRFGTAGVLLVTTLLVLAGAWLLQRPGVGDSTDVSVSGAATGPPPAVGAAAADFTARTVDGREVRLSDYRGRPVWLLFGASWCASCRAEVADVEAAYRQAKAAGVEVISVYLSEDARAVQDYTSGADLTYLHVPDPGTQIASTYRVMGIPAHYFIDQNGSISSIDVGALDRGTMDARVASISR